MRPLLPLATVLLAALTALTGCGADHGSDEGSDARASGSAGPLPDAWRTEVWHGVSVEVPADWAYGGAPMDTGSGETLACYASAMVTPDGGQVRGDERRIPYVGRALMLTDVCQVYPFIGPDEDPPSVPSVWLGAAVEPGSDDLGGGWVRETVAASGTTVTVTSDDPALRERVLGSVAGPGTCAPTLPGAAGDGVAAADAPAPLEVCVYRRLWDSDPLELVYGTGLGRASADAFSAALADAPPAQPRCGEEGPSEVMLVTLAGDDGSRTLELLCGAVEVAPGEHVAAGDRVLDTLRVRGLPATSGVLIGGIG